MKLLRCVAGFVVFAYIVREWEKGLSLRFS
jgi:hypothetical protein